MTPDQMECDWLKQWNLYSPAGVALQDAETGEKITYGQLYLHANQLARCLQEEFGIRHGDRVAVLATNELEYIVLFYATQRLGAILVPINFRLTSREVAHIIEDSEPKLLIHQRQFDSVIAELDARSKPAHVLPFDGDNSLKSRVRTPKYPTDYFPYRSKYEDPSMIIYTSGTTGAPKGALITQKMLFWNSLNTTLRLNITQNDVQALFLPFFHTGGWNVLTTPFIHRGARTILLKKFDPDLILQLADQEGLTILFGVPTMMDMMYRSPSFAKAKLSTVRYAIVGGEPMPIDLIRAWEDKGIPIRQGYGLTEFGPNVFSLNQEDSLRKIGSIGFPNFYIQAKVVDNDGKELGDEQIGELVLKGDMCSAGYWRNPEATAHTIVDGWLHTGDLVRRDAEGYYYVVGRKKDMYKSGGENVYPAEIEQFLRTHPKIHEAAVIGIPDAKWGEVGKAFITLNAGQSMTEEEFFSFCLGKLAKYKTPKQLRILKSMPKGDSGKILKRALIDLP